MLLKKNSVQALLIIAFMFVSTVHAATSPVQIATRLAGVGTDSPNILLVALPIQNVGTATAQNVKVTSIALTSSTLIGPNTLPMPLGDLAKDDIVSINAQFDRSGLVSGSKYRMTVGGTYQVAGKTYGFKVNRNITTPSASPGSANLRSSTITPFTMEDPANFPISPRPPKDEPKGRNPKRPPVPIGKTQIMYPNAFLTNPMSEQPPGGGPGSGAPRVTFESDGTFGLNGGTPPDPSGASGGTGNRVEVVLTTGNTYASVSLDGGQTFTNINPFCMFGYIACDAAGNQTGAPRVDGNLCCDQVVQYVPAINRFVWLMQTWPTGWVNGARNDALGNSIAPGSNRLRIVVVSPDDVRSWATGGGSSWRVFDLTTATLGLTGANDWLDYPDLAVGNNFLYVGVDKISGNGGLIVARIRLDQLATANTLNIEYTAPADIDGRAHGSHLTQNSGDAMFWAGHNATNKLTVFNMPETSNRYGWRDVDINTYSNVDYSSNTPTGTNWLAGSNGFGLENVQAAVRVPFVGLCSPGSSCPADEVWFAWGAGKNTGNSRPQPYVEVVHLDSQNFTLKQQMHIWNPSFAFAYPAFARNAANDIGVAIAVGGGDREAHTSVGFMGDFQVWALSTSTSSISRYGDYVTVRKAHPNDKLFSAVGYGITIGGFEPRYALFGRFCDVNPDDPSCVIIVR